MSTVSRNPRSSSANPDPAELEFHNFQTPSEDGYDNPGQTRDLAGFLAKGSRKNLRPLTGGMFGYSISRPAMNKQFFYDIFDQSQGFGCELEAWHTESGPGVLEAVSNGNTSRCCGILVDRPKYLTLLTGSQSQRSIRSCGSSRSV